MVSIKKIIFYLFIVTIILLTFPTSRIETEDVHTRQFCAYGRLFVEFEKDNKIWGTTYLDQQGHPVPCSEDGRNLTMSVVRL
jgi:hypothetical protein